VDAWQCGQFLVPQCREMVEVPRGDPQEVVGVAEEALCVPDLGQRGYGGFEGGDGAGVAAFQGDLHEGLESHPDGGGVHQRPIAGDDAAALEFTQPPVARAGCEPHPVGELGDRQPAVGLKLSKDCSVYGVHTDRLLPKVGVAQQKLQAFVPPVDVTS
jgi:hypothetical protein